MKLQKFLIPTLLLLAACNDDVLQQIDESQVLVEESQSFSIPVDSALSTLNKFLTVFDEPRSRAGGNVRQVATISAIKHPKSNSRSIENNCEYHGGVYVKTEEWLDYKKMLHCDFGNSGLGNGYYVENVFKLNDSSAEIDCFLLSNYNYHFNTYLRIINYDGISL